MKIEVDESLFKRHFEDLDRVGENGFSYPALKVLFEYLKDIESSTGEEINLDPVAICCDFAELTEEEALNDFCVEDIDDLERETIVIDVPGTNTYVVQAF